MKLAKASLFEKLGPSQFFPRQKRPHPSALESEKQKRSRMTNIVQVELQRWKHWTRNRCRNSQLDHTSWESKQSGGATPRHASQLCGHRQWFYGLLRSNIPTVLAISQMGGLPSRKVRLLRTQSEHQLITLYLCSDTNFIWNSTHSIQYTFLNDPA